MNTNIQDQYLIRLDKERSVAISADDALRYASDVMAAAREHRVILQPRFAISGVISPTNLRHFVDLLRAVDHFTRVDAPDAAHTLLRPRSQEYPRRRLMDFRARLTTIHSEFEYGKHFSRQS